MLLLRQCKTPCTLNLDPDSLSLACGCGLSFWRLPHFSFLISSVCQPHHFRRIFPPLPFSPPSSSPGPPPSLFPYIHTASFSLPAPSSRSLQPTDFVGKVYLVPRVTEPVFEIHSRPSTLGTLQSLPDDSPFLATNQPASTTNNKTTRPSFTFHKSLSGTTSHAVLSILFVRFIRFRANRIRHRRTTDNTRGGAFDTSTCHRDYSLTHHLHRGFTRDISHSLPIAMQLTSILAAAMLPLLALADDPTSGTTTVTQTSTLTKTVTLASNTVTMTASVTATGMGNSSSSSSGYPTGTGTGSYSAKVTSTKSSSSSSSSSSASTTPGVNGMGNGAASLSSSHVVVAGLAGMLVVALL